MGMGLEVAANAVLLELEPAVAVAAPLLELMPELTVAFALVEVLGLIRGR